MISICNMKKMWEMKPSIIFGFYIKYVIFTSLLCIFNPLCRGTIRQYVEQVLRLWTVLVLAVIMTATNTATFLCYIPNSFPPTVSPIKKFFKITDSHLID